MNLLLRESSLIVECCRNSVLGPEYGGGYRRAGIDWSLKALNSRSNDDAKQTTDLGMRREVNSPLSPLNLTKSHNHSNSYQPVTFEVEASRDRLLVSLVRKAHYGRIKVKIIRRKPHHPQS